jgi:pyrroloquinoline quinone (PQQ) biosynthesis protein C
LMRAKLQADMKSAPTSGISVKEFMEGFRAAVTQAETDSNLVEEIGNAKDRENMVRYVKNYLAMTGGFTHQLFSIAKVATGRLKSVLIHNIGDEYTDGKEHRELRYVWPRQLGVEIVPTEAVLDPEYLTETFSVQNFRTGVSLLPNPLIGTGMFYSLEGLFPDLATRLGIALKQIGIEEKYLEHLKIHETADVEHINDGLEAICETVKEGQQLQQVLNGAVLHVEMRHKMMEAVRRLIGYPSGNAANKKRKAA